MDNQQQYEWNPKGQMHLERMRLVKQAECRCFDKARFGNAESRHYHDHGKHEE